MFDGVHLGHQHVVRQAQLDARASGAKSVVITFDPHPLSVVAPERAPKLLQPLEQRLRLLAGLGVAATLVVRFTPELSRQEGESFVRELVTGFGRVRSFTVGEGFQFGHRRSGDVPLLERLGHEFGFRTNAAQPIRIGDEVVSSTRVRASLRDGNFGRVAALLGRPYAVTGIVQSGDRLGRQLGFPTANLDVSGLELPPLGVYAVRVRHRGDEHLGALNLGQRPTVAGAAAPVRCEVHLLDFSGDLYGQEISAEFVQPLRAEQKFDGVDALRAQIARDVSHVRSLLV
jgi:riboflavin kinase/FMN adenylyltransferase